MGGAARGPRLVVGRLVAQLREAVEERRAHVLEGGALDRVAEEAPRRLEVVRDAGRAQDAVVAVAHEDRGRRDVQHVPDGVAAGGGRRRGEVDAAVRLRERGLDRGLDRAAFGRRGGAGRPRLARVRVVQDVTGAPRRQEDAVAVLVEVGVEHLARRQAAPPVWKSTRESS